MANNHSTVSYIEPNYMFSGLTAAANDGFTYDRAPDLEDYCISMDICVELSSRDDALKTSDKANNTIILSYSDNGKASKVSFMSGTKIGGHVVGKDGKNNDISSKSYPGLTTYGSDLYITDLVDYGTTEMIGIKSVNIDYGSGYIPQIKIQFTDVRGMSLFQPKELNYDKSYNGIRGFSKDNIAQCFFQCFFTLPLPRFTIRIKGFYGNPVTYEVMCNGFKSNFNSATGDFDIDASFIGYGFSFMSDISFDALMSAPYSDYFGKKYWDDQVANGRFRIPDKTGQNMQPMPRLYEIRKNFEDIEKNSNNDFLSTTVSDEEVNHTLEIAKLNELIEVYRRWYEALYDILTRRYGKELVYIKKSSDGKDYSRIVIVCNNKVIPSNYLSEAYEQFDDSFKDINNDLYAKIEEYNNSSEAYKKLINVSKDFSDYSKIRLFNNLYVNANTRKIVFNGVDDSIRINKHELIGLIFTEDEIGVQKKLRKFYDDGISQYVYGFIIEQDYSDVLTRLAHLVSDANKSEEEHRRNKGNKEFNQSMFAKMGWYPTIENFSKIVMAHLETLMAMMNDVVGRVQKSERTASYLGITTGKDGNACDVNPNTTYIPPFPRITKLVTGDDNISKKEDAWIGNFGKPGGEIPEVDIVNGLFNGMQEITAIEESIKQQEEERRRGDVEEVDECQVPFPLSSFDFYITKNPYGEDTSVFNDIYAFAGIVCMRMFNILSLNFFRNEHTSWLSQVKDIAEVEAVNCHERTRFRNSSLLKAIDVGGEFADASKIIDVVTGKYKVQEGEKIDLPWALNGSDEEKVLFSEDEKTIWLTKYASKFQEYIYPIQNPSFSELNNIKKQFDDRVVPENDDIIVSELDQPNKLLAKTNYMNAYHNLYVEDDFKRFKTIIDNVSTNGTNEAYTRLCKEFISKSIECDGKTFGSFFKSGLSSFNCRLDDSIVEEKISVIDIGTRFEDGKYSDYTSDVSAYTELVPNTDTVNGAILNRVFDYKIENGKYKINHYKSILSNPEMFSSLGSSWVETGGNNVSITEKQRRCAFFVMCCDCFNYANISKYIGSNNPKSGNRTFSYLPKLLVLQIGALLAVHSCKASLKSKINLDKIRNSIPVPDGFEVLTKKIDLFNPLSKLYLIKYFLKWGTDNYSLLTNLFAEPLKDDDGTRAKLKFHSTSCYQAVYVDGKDYWVGILNQKSEIVKAITNNLMLPVIMTRGNINSMKYNNGSTLTRNDFPLSRAVANEYLTAFMNKLRQLKGIGDENGSLTTQARSSNKTTEDMKIELYRYLKQIFDKWIPTTNFETWKYDSFFNYNDKEALHQFHFIDSYYNKIGNKLLINPKLLSEKIAASISYTDINVMMHTFLADVFSAHRCMLRCIQGFADLGNQTAMEEMFTLLPYNRMRTNRVHPDFVVVYTYEPSKNLNVENGEYNDDGFMLNEESETPLPIRTRPSDTSKYYRIPAFGVSYGRQYQSVFKSVNFNMDTPIQTQQALLAKHAILKASRDETSKVVTAQDLYDIYSTQSITCSVEMIGCAWVQPMMYFVVLNVPMFRGSYMIMKVNHKITPGNMVTTFTGCRMANTSNKFVEDIFSLEDYTSAPFESQELLAERAASYDNDCPYKEYPLIDDVGEYEGGNPSGPGGKFNSAKEFTVGIYNAWVASGVDKEIAKVITAQEALESGWGTSGCAEKYNYGGVLKSGGGCYVFNSIAEFVKFKTDKSLNKYFPGALNAKTPKEYFDILQGINGKGNPKTHYCDSTDCVGEKYMSKIMNGSTSVYNKVIGYLNEAKPKANTTTNAQITNDNLGELLFNAVQKSLHSSTAATVSIKYEKDSSGKPKKPLVITQTDGKTSKLAYVYDIILNSKSYYKYIQSLHWCYKNDMSEDPCCIIVETALKPDNNSKGNYVSLVNNSYTIKNSTNKVPAKTSDGKIQVNDKLLNALSKQYGVINNENNGFKKDNPQFSEALNVFEEINITNCGSIMGGNVNPNGGGKITEGGMIDNWNANKAANWLACASKDSSLHICAFAVQQAVVAGGIEFERTPKYSSSCNGYRVALNLQETGKWELVGNGRTDKKTQINFKPQVGDIIGMTKGSNTEAPGHVCMYCGQQYGWISDFKQGQRPYPYSQVGEYWIVRYKGGAKATTANPGRCFGGKCLNNCSI